ncbi:hypothetical protein BD626DRAFT_550247 [Schizophyllum amplum]|uniref:Endonuclease n=1 Tax=Schizophyllum amplum TaxID=97359 RepID=A0A550C3M0_9AGAR|nr:hypothetical protein BD626DRAFT_550247 [Auriculariopsis ampla]
MSPKGVAQLTDMQPIGSLVSPVLMYGNPGPISDALVRKAYVAAYDRRLRHPAWTAEHLTLASLGKSALAGPEASEAGDRGKSAFVEDPSIPAMFRAKLSDYFRSGYDRGICAVPAADAKISQAAMDETFFLSNIAPQVGDGFNRHYWAYLEDWCRRLTGTFTDVYVFTVPLYLPKQDTDGKWRVHHEVIGSPPNVSVPTHFAKSSWRRSPVSTGAFVLPNAVIPDDAPLESFVVLVMDAVERAAGLTLFSDAVKGASKHICQTAKCQVVVRRFDDARKKAVGAPRK